MNAVSSVDTGTLLDYLRSQQAQQDLEQAVTLLVQGLEQGWRDRGMTRPLYTAVLSRIKTEESIRGKIHRKRYGAMQDPLERINDLFGMRVICNFLDDVYTAAALLAELPQVELIRQKDYIRQPKDSGYRGIHMILWVELGQGRRLKMEVQLRTAAMNFWSELDYELCYKRTGGRSLYRVGRRLRRQSAVIARMDEEMIELRREIEAL